MGSYTSGPRFATAMEGNASVELSIDWDTEDELEINEPRVKDSLLSSSSSITIPSSREANGGIGEASSSSGPTNSRFIQHFLGMGFPKKLVVKAIKENGEGNSESVLEALLTYSAIEDTPQLNQGHETDDFSSGYEEGCLQDFSDSDSYIENEENTKPLSEIEKKLMSLVEMGYVELDASVAIDRCGPDSSITELTDFILAAQLSREADALLPNEEKPRVNLIDRRKRKLFHCDLSGQKGQRKKLIDDDMLIRLPNPMIGYGVPDDVSTIVNRTIPECAIGPPFFYYENVALAPKGVWSDISRFLYEIEPEFVDSKYFCAAARKRGYVHNLPIKDRYPVVPIPPRTIHDALPLTRRWWPAWDKRNKLNCLQTCVGSARLTDRIRKALEECPDVPPLSVQKYVLDECRKWNLVWVGRNKVAPLEPDEVEMLLGFPRNHTRGGGISRTDRYKSLGNSFQVDTVAYHFSVLKDLFPGGMTVLSLFSGIGGAEVALHRLGIPLKTVVSVEISETNRNIVRSWWEQTNQMGTLVDFADVQRVTTDVLEQLINTYGGFDLVVGGSPCNNLTGSNRVSRDGLEGKESSLFYDYFRILDSVKCIMGGIR